MSTSAPTEMQVKKQNLNEATVQLDIVCSPSQVRSGFQKAVKQLGKKIKLPGFRPGQAPAAMLERAIPENDLYNAAADEILKSAFDAALKQESITPAGQPIVEFNKLEKDEAVCEFAVKIPLPPIVELGDYKALSYQSTAAEVTDEEVERQIEELRRRGGKQEKVTDRGIQEGDMAVVNIKQDGDQGDGRTFMTIAGQTFPGLDSQIMGMAAEEIKSAELEFPANFQDKDWAGTKANCQITIRSISSVQVPELDDTFAQSLNAQGVEDLKEKVVMGIKSAKEKMSNDMVHEQLLDQLSANSKIIVATTTWESVADRRLREMAAELGQQRKTLETYAKDQNMTVEQLREALQHEAKIHVERAVMIETIFKNEGMVISDDEANRHFIEVAQSNGIQPDDLPKFVKEYGPQIREEVIYRSMHSMVLNFLRENATQGEAPAAAPAAPKKKSTKKKSE